MEIAQDRNLENPFPSPVRHPSLPGTPLQQVSPERLNQQRALPQSPSVSNFESHGRRESDVKSRVAFLNSLTGSPNRSPARGGSPNKRYEPSTPNAALQRAVLGREEAETALNDIHAQLESAKARERLVAERVESLMEQLQEARMRQKHERQVYEKEMKGSKKNEYKAELNVIKLQEEQREMKNELEQYRARANHDQAEKEKARQEAFERAYAIAGITEELQTLKEKLKAVEQERDNAVVAAASKIALHEHSVLQEQTPMEQELNTEADQNGKRKRPMPTLHDPEQVNDLDNMITVADDSPPDAKLTTLQQEIKLLRRQRREDQEMIYFMNMQCQFKACPCRQAERDGTRFVHDYEYDQKVRDRYAKKRKLDDDPSVPSKFMSWRQKQEAKKGKQAQISSISEPNTALETSAKEPETQPQEAGPDAMLQHETLGEPQASSSAAQNSDIKPVELQSEADVAAQIPLPPPTDTPECTANLEEITQVIVEAANNTQTFSFSTSQGPRSTRAPVQSSKSCLDLSEDLFNLSPPKRAPARPSTAMGIVRVDSPIRLVPDSPQVSPEHAKTQTVTETTRVRLNDASPAKPPRSAHRSHSRGRSPLNDNTAPDRVPQDIALASSAAGSWQAHVEPRSWNQVQQSHPDQYFHGPTSAQVLNETSTTTTIPLKSEDDGQIPTSYATHGGASRTVLNEEGSPPFNVPGTPISREAALAQIRARRDRARSVNLRKSATEGASVGGGSNQNSSSDGGAKDSGARDRERGEGISRPKTPTSTARRGIKVDLHARLGLGGGAAGIVKERAREASHASAPGRF